MKGFIDWKDAPKVLSRHGICDYHKAAASALSTKANIADMLSISVASKKKANHDYMLEAVSTVHFLAHQGQPLRGDGPFELDSNFHQLLVLRGKDYLPIKQFYKRNS